MAHVPPPARHRDAHRRDFASGRGVEHEGSERDSLREENAELRRLVIELSKLVIKNVVEREH
jgi:hypothetical protein